MEQYVAGAVSAAISGRHIPNQKQTTKNYKLKESDQLSTPEKNFQFIDNSKDMNYKKYKINSCSTKMIHKDQNEVEGNRRKNVYKFKRLIHLDSKNNTEVSGGKKRKLRHDQTEKMEASKVEQTNVTGSEYEKLKGDNHKNSHDINNETLDTNSLNKYNTLPRENKQMKKWEKNNNSAEKDDYTIYVGNLPLKYDHKKVVKLFNKFGKVENARIRCVPIPGLGFSKRKAAITKQFHANRNSVSAYVVFKDKESVSKAIELNGMIIDGHHLRIDKAVPQKKDFKKSIFVGSLPYDIEDDELWNFFKDCGEIDSVRVVRDDKFFVGKGFGYINFKSSASVELALALNGHEIKNRKINVQRCTSKKKKENFKKLLPLKKGKKDKKQSKHKNCSSGFDKNSSKHDFQGREANHKQKKKKRKFTKDAARKNKIMSTLKLSLKKNKSEKTNQKKIAI